MQLNEYVPTLLEGISGMAFHGVIQLGYGLEVMDGPNVAEGLAYWTYCYTSVGKVKNIEEVCINDNFITKRG